MATKKYQITQLQNDDSLLVLHPETSADIVVVDNSSGNYSGTATNVQDALEEVYTLAQTGGVTGVKGDSESSYRQGNVNITKANIGLGNVTNDKQVKGLSSGTTNGNLVKFGADGYTIADAGVSISTSAPSSTSTDSHIPTAKAVWDAIDSIPEPMIFKGTLGTGGTITTLPSASSSNEGYTYKVITDGTYQNLVCKVGDVVISNGSAWTLIPSGDDVEDTWRGIFVANTKNARHELVGNSISTGNITFIAHSSTTLGAGLTLSSGEWNPNQSGDHTITIGVDSANGYQMPTTADFSTWNAKYDLPSGGIPKTDLASAVQSSLSKADSALQSNQTITLSGDASGSGRTSITVTLANTGVSAGTYTAVTVDTKGRVTNGGMIIEVGSQSQSTPSNSLAVGGLFFKQV